MIREKIADNILFTCSAHQYRGNEQFVAEHTLGFIVAGETHLFINNKHFICKEGSMGLAKKNQLLKSVKYPPARGEFKSVSILLTQEILRQYSRQHNISSDVVYEKVAAIQLPQDNIFLQGDFQSLMPYFLSNENLSSSLAEIKVKEAVEILLKIKPELKNLLFDFNEPHKIDLEAFMNRNFSYNVSLSNFATLTGRSLAGFKRDFKKVFKTSPGIWLLQRRLTEAYFLIKEKNKKPSDVYLDVGFENLSHFSHAFKKVYGTSPSML